MNSSRPEPPRRSADLLTADRVVQTGEARPSGAFASQGRFLLLVRLIQMGRKAFLSEYLVLYLSVLFFLAAWPFTPGLATGENLRNILSNMLPLLLVATGQTVVLITGGIDLSVTSIIALSSVCGALVMNADQGLLQGSVWAMPGGIAVMLLVGLGLGLLNGACVTRFNMPPFIVTLTAMMFFSGLAIRITHSQNIYGLPDAFNLIGKNIGLSLLSAGLLAGLAHGLLSRSLYGRWLYAVGHNGKAARVSGVPVRGAVLLAYAVSGIYAAAASVLYTGRLETGSPILGQRILLDVIGATVIGGTSLYGGKGKVIWTVFGVLFLTLIENCLNLLNLSHFTIMMVKGGVILFAAWLDTFRKGYAPRA